MKILNNKIPSQPRLLLTALLGLAVAAPVAADEFHYRDILIGDRAAGLGGAFTAIADDASGLYYNPAGVVYSAIPRLSGSVSAYNYRTTEYSNLSKANPDQTWTRTSASMVANYFGVVQPLGTGTVGFSIAVPNYDLENQNDAFYGMKGSQALAKVINGDTNGEVPEIDQFIDFNNEDNTLLFGPSYGLQLADNLSVGLTLYGYYRKRETTNWQYAKTTGDAPLFETVYYQKIQTRELGIQPRLGIMWSPVERLSLGLMVQNTFILSQSPEYRQSEVATKVTGDGADGYTHRRYEWDFVNNEYVELEGTLPTPWLEEDIDNDLPWEFNFGLAYFPTNDLLFSADFSYALETDVYEATWNAAAGAEYFLSPAWAVRAGTFTNNANTPSKVAESGLPHVNLLGGAFSISRYTANSNITLGINYSYGSGEANLNPGSSHTQDIEVHSLSAYVSASASF